MPWPLSQDYNEAIQCAALSFSDAELKATEARCNAIGIPMPRSGNFADVYEMTGPGGKKWAVKCFTRQVQGLRERYAAISAYLKQVDLPFMVDFSYLDQGIRVKGQWYPILKMHWVEGFTLNEFIRENADQPQYLELLSQIWLRLARRLREARMAHADLQHGNVLLVPGAKATSLAVRLIDYDGMFVPALANQPSGEVGHPAYQHPQRLREGTYSREVDRFPHLVIYTALRGLMIGGRYLWNKYDNGDNLLFRQQDLEAPANSALFAELRKRSDGEVGKLVEVLAQSAQQPLNQTPLLDELIDDRTAIATRRKPAVTVPAAPAVEETPEAIFGAAVAGEATPARTPRGRGPSIGKSHGWLWATAAVLLVGVGLAGVFLIVGKERPRNTGADAGIARGDPAPSQKDLPPPSRAQASGKQDPAPLPIPPPPPAPNEGPGPKPNVDPPAVPAAIPAPQLAYRGSEAAGAFTRHRLTITNHQAFPAELFQPAPDLPAIGLNKAASRTLVHICDANGRRLYGFVAFQSPADLEKLWFAVAKDATAPSQVYVMLEDRRLQRQYQSNLVAIGAAGPAAAAGERRRFEGHTGTIWSVAFSPDGKRIASASSDRAVKVWDAATGKDLQTYRGHTGLVRRVVFSPDNERIASAGDDRTLKVWNAATGQDVFTLTHTSSVGSLAFSPDGKRILSGEGSGTVRVWDAASGKVVLTIQGTGGSWVQAAFSPDGKRIVSGSGRRVVKLWDATTAREILSLEHTSFVDSVAFSPDGTLVISGSRDRTLKVWDAASGKEVRTLRGDHAAFSPDGKRILSSSSPGSLSVWDTATGQETLTLKGHSGSITCVAFAPDGRNVLSGGSDLTVRLWTVPGATTATAGPTPGPLPAGVLAHFRFKGDGRDAVKGNPELELKNTEFKDDGLYLNGKYEGNVKDGYRFVCKTPALDYTKFTVALRFKPEAFGPKQTNLFTGGTSYRWFGLVRSPAGNLTVTLNNYQFAHEIKGAAVDPGKWTVVVCGVDLSAHKIIVHLNGQKTAEIDVPQDLKLQVIDSAARDRDKVWSFSNYASGDVFHGLVDEVIIFGRVLSAEEFGQFPLRP